ncbi:hypothetical protein CEUSTIGMA_g6773.t1 [Chlamydomonas eustigma]|uniref:Uncharacterized protein n=1 Tax=Chlamydomonas eustigma TaxID=1157962 RepID=A0A250X8W0_9CHLO|nr:hypothetical protein CEUSTIGMA_g6773.t1 [Chlamydomonas eustigma]|eukprot:GAX79332.1 hypothetical protein CEUSTIGMA_g6773.t1 [Chlamydomonas eustigma]
MGTSIPVCEQFPIGVMGMLRPFAKGTRPPKIKGSFDANRRDKNSEKTGAWTRESQEAWQTLTPPMSLMQKVADAEMRRDAISTSGREDVKAVLLAKHGMAGAKSNSVVLPAKLQSFTPQTVSALPTPSNEDSMAGCLHPLDALL